MEKISVLMGTYNEKRALAAAAIDSILKQTYQEFEFLICDDGSEKEFYRWLYNYCKKDERIKLLRNKKNRGLAVALNRCLYSAVGSYIARMDADDVSAEKRLEKQIAFLHQHKEYALVGCNAQLIDRNGVWGERRLQKIPDRRAFLHTSPFIHPSIMMRREVLEKIHGYSESIMALRVEDYEMFMRLYAAGYQGYNIQENLFLYREDRGSFGKRKYRYRLNECMIRYQGFRSLKIRKGNFRYIVKPLLAGLIPAGILRKMHIRKFGYRVLGE